ncbi:hypothetical protein M5689_006519 [Euphorbia peplus]|nr:hypothetical protein M5689_006519 [Euphorbia peplus]
MRYPELARIAQDILAILISTVASESAFSIGGKVITSTRSSLKANTIQTLMCLKDWIITQDEGNFIGPEETDSSSEDDEGFDVDSSTDSDFSNFS